ncbi:conjugal transfer protein [Streptococcus pneumoniae]|uniref:conjugal transfer protein n=1 Tax=Streptococcus pneumoniae TaxID=1313 RepID=UPI0006DC1520|nr:conjugal transfer protein [Streptococcus pneumoniae]
MRKEDLMMKFRKNQNKEKQIPKEKKPRVYYKVNPHKKVVIALWVLLGLSFSFAIFKHFTAIDTHTIHETTIIEKEYVDTHHVENFVENFAKVYYSWEQSDKSIDNRMESLKGYLTDELQALNVDTVRKDIPVSSSVRGFQIWTVEPTGDNEFNVTYSVDQLITEGENTKTVHSAYIVSVYVDSSGNMVLVKNPTITNIPKKSSYKPKAIESEGTVDSITTNEINEFLTTFFKLYPTATASELSYYVNDGILKPIGKEYIFQELVNPIHNRKDNQVTVSLTVEYIDQQTKATQVSQFDLVLEKNGSNWKIIE